MRFYPRSNYLLEALIYLGDVANRQKTDTLEDRLTAKGVEDLTAFRAVYGPFAELSYRLDRAVHIPQDALDRLFADLPGFQDNSGGAFSLAFMLLFPVVEEYHDDLDAFLERMEEMEPDQVARNLLVSLDLTDDLGSGDEGCAELLMDEVLTMNAPPESRLSILEAHRSYKEIIREAGQWIRVVLDALETERTVIDGLGEQVYKSFMRNGIERTLRKITSVTLHTEMHYHLRPLIMSPGMNLFADWPQENAVMFYCGALRQFLVQQIETASYNVSNIYEAIKVLGDKTRFDIVCYLRQQPAYGQELSNHFGLARNTIHHHMGKLLDVGLVACSVDGNRVYYHIDEDRIRHLLDRLSALFMGREIE